MKLNRSWLMALCVIGIGALLILPSLGISIGTLFTFLLILACPLMHLFMMRGSHGGHDQGTGINQGSAPKVEASLPAQEKKAVEG